MARSANAHPYLRSMNIRNDARVNTMTIMSNLSRTNSIIRVVRTAYAIMAFLLSNPTSLAIREDIRSPMTMKTNIWAT